MKDSKFNQYCRSIILLGIFFTAVACQAFDIAVSPQLEHSSPVYTVKGRNGFFLKQILTFGPYTTSKVKRGWIKSYNSPFMINFRGSSEKFSFTQYSKDSFAAEIFCLGKINSIEYKPFSNFWGIPIEYENTFSGSIFLDENNYWDFIVNNPEAGIGQGQFASSGYAKSNHGLRIEIMPIKKLSKGKNIMQIANFGFEFYINEKPIAAVSTIDKGKVWIVKTIGPELEKAVISLASAILLRSSIGENMTNQ
ncbi:MAG: hypothetical protein WC716_12660 [Chitinophagaceae bacterium]|jgi:hypothetical protein